jgi:hypothetical protein
VWPKSADFELPAIRPLSKGAETDGYGHLRLRGRGPRAEIGRQRAGGGDGRGAADGRGWRVCRSEERSCGESGPVKRMREEEEEKR